MAKVHPTPEEKCSAQVFRASRATLDQLRPGVLETWNSAGKLLLSAIVNT
jgi:hypothetical protein